MTGGAFTGIGTRQLRSQPRCRKQRCNERRAARATNISQARKIAPKISHSGPLRPRDNPQCHHSGRPLHARAPHAGRMTRSGRSPGSRVLALLRLPRPCTRKAQWHLGEGLTADSCGGSSGFDLAEANRTEFPLGRSTRPAHLNGSIGSVSADPCQRKSRRYSIPGYTSCERVASQQHLASHAVKLTLCRTCWCLELFRRHD